MNQLTSRRETMESELATAMDETVTTAVALGLSEAELVDRLLERFRPRISRNVVNLHGDPRKKLFDPLAGS